MPKSDSGFNEEQFRKLVAMFDSPYRNEAIVAFNKALDELAKDQKRFCDRLVDATEAKIAKVECKRIRTELASAFEKLAKREAEAKQLEETISVLRQRIATMEEVHRGSDVRSSEKDADFYSVPDYNWTDESAAQADAVQNGAASERQVFGFDFQADPPAEPEPVDVDPGSPMPFGIAFSWLSLLALVLLYALWSMALWHPLTDGDWQSQAPVFFLLIPTAALALFFVGRRRGFANSELGKLCSKILGSWRAMAFGLSVVLCTYFVALIGFLDHSGKDAQYQHVAILGLVLGFSFIALVVTREIVNFGLKGLFLHACMFIDVMTVAFAVVSQRAPWDFAQKPYPPPVVHPGIVLIASLILLFGGWSERVTFWFLEDDDEYLGEDEHGKPIQKKNKRSDWITFPGVIILILTIFGPRHSAEGHVLPRTPAPHHSTTLLRSDGKNETPHLILAQEDVPAPLPAHDTQPAEWKLWCFVIGSSLVILRVAAWRLHKARLRKAWREANTFRPANVHGAAGYAKAKQARKAGWI